MCDTTSGAADIDLDNRWPWLFDKLTDLVAGVEVIKAGQKQQNGMLADHETRIHQIESDDHDDDVRRAQVIKFLKSGKGALTGVAGVGGTGLILGILQAMGAGFFLIR